ncbi:2-hydroxyacid dehydrogenase [Kaistella pullorum]|uniref:Hydroxyacid dehydrogenase n=1 Tax=Kaistella pullorum TaxID=2763074 RepID=A0ABR8WJK2_9FLAO|nr:2-hydroxyacid dehydrogenase [Kaistella pullorum]MBD8017195.1 hydroxyacid dehydrogenase [Kaistella pullorum]
MKILQIDKNHPLLTDQLTAAGFMIEDDFSSTYAEICEKISVYDGIIIRSRIPIDQNLLENATQLKFIARVGSGMENIDCEFAKSKGIELINSPEGNRDSVAEHVLGMLLMLMHRLQIAASEVKNGIWRREENRGDELRGKTLGVIGYGVMGKAVARRLSGFGVKVIFYDIRPDLSDEFAEQVSLEDLKKEADILSIHLPETPETLHFVNEKMISEMLKDFYLVNTARGKNVNTKDLVNALTSGKIKGACLDVLEFEKPSFENLEIVNEDLNYLLNTDNVIVTPHIAGWTVQSKKMLAQVIVDKIKAKFQPN